MRVKFEFYNENMVLKNKVTRRIKMNNIKIIIIFHAKEKNTIYDLYG